MIAILHGGFDPPRTRRIQLQIREDVAILSDDPTVQFEGEAMYRLEMRTFVPEGETESITLPSGVKTLVSTDVLISPLLGDLQLSDFPEGFTFGNGCSGPKDIEKHRTDIDGNETVEIVPVKWCVVPPGTVLADARWSRLQEIFEGIPPGSPETNVWREFDVNGRDPAVYDLDGNLL